MSLEVADQSVERVKMIEENLRIVNQNIKDAYESIPNNPTKYPLLVGVTKIKSKEFVIEAYRCGLRHFGENYIQELHEKANDPELREKCPEIKWHIIGPIQTNKINKLLDVPNLSMIQTIHTQKLASALNSHIARNDKIQGKIDCLVQVNTSNEDVKSGAATADTADLVKFIINECDRLNFRGLMTIGAYGYDTSLGPNPDFLKLVEVREDVCKKLELTHNQVELSMGMSTDYAHAITLGAAIVRVGSVIFGDRPTWWQKKFDKDPKFIPEETK